MQDSGFYYTRPSEVIIYVFITDNKKNSGFTVSRNSGLEVLFSFRLLICVCKAEYKVI